MADYEVLSPWAEVEPVPPRALLPRVTDLNGKTIGLFSYFKQHGPAIMKEVERQLQERFPTAKFSQFQYPVQDVEILTDADYKDKFEEWVNGVDTVVTGHGD